MATYELMVILSGDMTQNEAEKHLETVKGYIAENGGSVTEELIWGKRELAYAIKKNNVGFYAIYHFTMEGRDGMHELKNELRLDQKVLRDLIMKVPHAYTFAEFGVEAAVSAKAKEEAMAKRKKVSIAPKKEETHGSVEVKKEAAKPSSKPKKKSTSDTVLDDPDLKL